MGLGLNWGPPAGIGGPQAAFGGLSPGQFFQSVILQAEADKLLTDPDLPEDLRQRVLDTVANAEAGFNNCSTLATLPWIQIRCSALQLKQSKNELKAIENEAIARAQAAAAASTSAPAIA